jgi:4-amino-4-deoxy-L-arabinose transferase-like glycosyltransferase
MKYKLLFGLIIVCGLFLRLVNLTTPLLDYHSWRQTDTAMVARNFYEHGYRILYPQVDWDGSNTGYVAMEFPIYPFLCAVLYKIFGVKEWLGRLVSIFFSTSSIIILFKLARICYTTPTALIACAFFAILPLNAYYGRTFMPESLMIFSTLAGIYFFSQWIEKEKKYQLILAVIFTTLAILVKPYTFFYLIFPLLFPTWLKYGKKLIFNKQIWFFFLLVLVPPLLWYLHAMLHLKMVLYNPWSPKVWQSNLSLWLSPKFYERVLIGNLANRILFPTGFILFIAGVIQDVKDKKEYVFHLWLLGLIVYFIIFAHANYHHEYYQIPVVAPACVFIGKFLNNFFTQRKNWYKTFTGGIVLLLILSIPIYTFYKLPKREKINWDYWYAAQTIKKISSPRDLILVCDESFPEIIYYSHRKGWHIHPNTQSVEIIESFRKKGAKYYVTVALDKFWQNKSLSNYMIKNYPLLKTEHLYGNFLIFQLQKT